MSRPLGRGRAFVSGAVTTETAAIATAPHGLSDALKTLTMARYGRTEKFDANADEAVATAIRITQQQRSATFDGVGMGPKLLAIGRRFAEESLGVST